jgi:hypothetical protein
VSSLHQIDRRLSDLEDRSLLIALRQLGWNGLITNNYRMLAVPHEIAAIIKTRTTVVAVEGLGMIRCEQLGRCCWNFPAWLAASSRTAPTCSGSLTEGQRPRMPGITYER